MADRVDLHAIVIKAMETASELNVLLAALESQGVDVRTVDLPVDHRIGGQENGGNYGVYQGSVGAGVFRSPCVNRVALHLRLPTDPPVSGQ